MKTLRPGDKLLIPGSEMVIECTTVYRAGRRSEMRLAISAPDDMVIVHEKTRETTGRIGEQQPKRAKPI